MDIPKLVAELEAERKRIDKAIEALKSVAGGESQPRRGRPPKWIGEAKAKAVAGAQE